MTKQFEFKIPSDLGATIDISLAVGDVLYLMGANGTGKSSLVTLLFNQYADKAKRISAHRQTWLESGALDMSPRIRHESEQHFRVYDAQPNARYSDWNPINRTKIAIFDLIDASTMQERKIAALVRSNNIADAQKEAQDPSPIQVINELMRLSNLPVEISVGDRQEIVARKNGGNGYSVAELSDGERNAFLIASDVLTAKPGTLILIDEPERHLHRSIISPLLKLLFDHRSDCAFIVSTHELMLPLETPKASTLLVRNCNYQEQNVPTWTADLLAPGAVLDDALKGDILGSRRKMLFVEGTERSLDVPLYSLLFPQVSVVPKKGCRDVEYAVRGLRGADNIHWVSAWGIIDNDQRSPENISHLKGEGIWALSHYSVESLYYHAGVIARIAERLASVMGDDAEKLKKTAIASAIGAVKENRDHLVGITVLRSCRKKVLEGSPNKQEDIKEETVLKIEVDLAALFREEEKRFDDLVLAEDWDGLLTRYPLRESAAFNRVTSGLKLSDKVTYQRAVLTLIQENSDALSDLRNLLGNLYAHIVATV